MDAVDLAAAREDIHRSDALDRQRARAGIVSGTDWDGASAKWCAGCGSRIPDARRKALPGVQLCVGCAADAERQQRGYAR